VMLPHGFDYVVMTSLIRLSAQWRSCIGFGQFNEAGPQPPGAPRPRRRHGNE